MERKEDGVDKKERRRRMKRKGIEIEDKEGGGTEDKKSGRITETIMKRRKKILHRVGHESTKIIRAF